MNPVPALSLAAPQPSRRLVAGIGVSIVVHALILYGYRMGAWQAPDVDSKPPRTMTVWLRPPPAVESVPEPLPKPRLAKRSAPLAARQIRHEADSETAPARPTQIIAVRPAEDKPDETPVPRFDMDAARRQARTMANEKDPAKAGTALAQFPEPELGPSRNERAGRAIAQAKRRDCKDGLPGGLLAPIFLMLDKKDSGCKW